MVENTEVAYGQNELMKKTSTLIMRTIPTQVRNKHTNTHRK